MATDRIRTFLDRGVVMPTPSLVHIGDEVPVDAIASGVVLHPGTRVTGASTSIGPGCVLGEETAVTVDDSQLGRGVALKGGFVSGATFLDGANMGSGAHVRPGTLVEEEAGGAHAVGLKQTILQPFVTLGSLINFCDCLMGGGTSRKNHSEVGSSYIHFNYTPHQDKATASLIGDVPRGVLLDQPPIFLGGQGGLVGPTRIEFGCIVPAGVVHRYDATEPGTILYPKVDPPKGPHRYDASCYRDIRRIVRNNLLYIGNVRALQAWYTSARALLVGPDAYARNVHKGALERLEDVLAERTKRLKEFAGKLPDSAARLKAIGTTEALRWAADQASFAAAWPSVEERLKASIDSVGAKDRGNLMTALTATAKPGAYVESIRGLSPAAKKAAVAWLQAVVDSVASAWQAPAQ